MLFTAGLQKDHCATYTFYKELISDAQILKEILSNLATCQSPINQLALPCEVTTTNRGLRWGRALTSAPGAM